MAASVIGCFPPGQFPPGQFQPKKHILVMENCESWKTVNLRVKLRIFQKKIVKLYEN